MKETAAGAVHIHTERNNILFVRYLFFFFFFFFFIRLCLAMLQQSKIHPVARKYSLWIARIF
jgi:hypothetical protein